MNPARQLAVTVLCRVLQDGAYAAASLDAELGRQPNLDPRDGALATELVYGVLRTLGFLEDLARAESRTGALIDDPVAHAHLMVGFYTVAFLDQIPAFAAVSEAVNGVRDSVGPKPAAFANAVLRGYLRRLEGTPRPRLEVARAEGAPGWLRGALRRSLGRKEATQFLACDVTHTDLAARDAGRRDEVLAGLREARPEATFELGRHSPHAIMTQRIGPPRELPGFDRDWIVQEEGAQLLALMLGAKRGESILDACAGRGNKSWLLAEAVGAEGSVTLADKYPEKVAQATARFAALGVKGFAVDWLVGTGELEGRTFDRILVDAPCSGIGTHRRRPEIAIGRDPSSLLDLQRQQIAITQRAATLLKPGGTLLYAVCSVLREECEEVTQALSELQPKPLPDAFGIPLEQGSSSGRLLPHRDGTDGYYFALFEKR